MIRSGTRAYFLSTDIRVSYLMRKILDIEKLIVCTFGTGKIRSFKHQFCLGDRVCKRQVHAAARGAHKATRGALHAVPVSGVKTMFATIYNNRAKTSLLNHAFSLENGVCEIDNIYIAEASQWL